MQELPDKRITWHDDPEAPNPLYVRIQMLTEPGREGLTGNRHKVSGSPSPARTWAEQWWTDVHGGCRDLEDRLAQLLWSRGRMRPGSDGHTVAALRALPDLVDNATSRFPSHTLPRTVERDVARWHRSALELLGIRRPWRDAEDLECGKCGQRSLRVRPRDMAYVCTDTSCGHVYDTADDVRAYLKQVEEAG